MEAMLLSPRFYLPFGLFLIVMTGVFLVSLMSFRRMGEGFRQEGWIVDQLLRILAGEPTEDAKLGLLPARMADLTKAVAKIRTLVLNFLDRRRNPENLYAALRKELTDRVEALHQSSSRALAAAELLIPLGLMGTILGVLLSLSRFSEMAEAIHIFPELALAMLTSLLGLIYFSITKYFFEQPAAKAYDLYRLKFNDLMSAVEFYHADLGSISRPQRRESDG